MLRNKAARLLQATALKRSSMGTAIACPLELGLSRGLAAAGKVERRMVNACGSPRHECLARFKAAQKRHRADHCTLERRGSVRRSRSAAGLQVGFQQAMQMSEQAIAQLHSPSPMEVLAALPDEALLPLALNVALGMPMHDAEAAMRMGIEPGSGLSAVNGVGGGLWDSARCAAWCTRS